MALKISSNAANNSKKKRPRGKAFKKNDPETGEKDPRINRNGAPRVFQELRDKVLDLLTEQKETKDESGTVTGTRTELDTMLKLWAISQDFQKQNKLLEIGYGKVPDEIRHRTDEEEFVSRYLHAFTDGELDRIRHGESGFDILVSKLESQFGNKPMT